MPLIYDLPGESPENRVARLNAYEQTLKDLEAQVKQQAEDVGKVVESRYTNQASELALREAALAPKEADLLERMGKVSAREVAVSVLEQDATKAKVALEASVAAHQDQVKVSLQSLEALQRQVAELQAQLHSKHADLDGKLTWINSLQIERDNAYEKDLAVLKAREEAVAKAENEMGVKITQADEALAEAHQLRSQEQGKLDLRESEVASREQSMESAQQDVTAREQSLKERTDALDKREAHLTEAEASATAQAALNEKAKEALELKEARTRRDGFRVRMLAEKVLLRETPSLSQAEIDQRIDAMLEPAPDA